MRTALHQFFRPTRDDFERLWKEALIAYDASALLNIYGYSEDTRFDLIAVIRHYADRSRLPYQFALEYARNRISTIVKQIKNYQNTENDFKKIETVRLQPAGSTGRRNTSVKSLCWGFKLQGLTWSFV
jgi:hypothetical protein